MTTLNGKALLQHGHSLACRFAGRVGLETAQDLGCEAMVRAVASPAPDGRMEPWLERIFEGNRADPNGDWIFVPAGVKYDSLIEIPTNFAAAFEKMVEDRL